MSTVAIIGASPNVDRYSNLAQKALLKHGHNVFPVTPAGGTIDGIACYKSVSEIIEPIDTVTLYIGPKHLAGTIDQICDLHPRRVIFNPGTEDSGLMNQLKKKGIEVLEACTLVLLSTNQF